MKLTKAHFCKATSVPWSVDACLLQQPIIEKDGLAVIWPPDDARFKDRELAEEIMNIFDKSHYAAGEIYNKSEKLTGLALIYSMLPLDV